MNSAPNNPSLRNLARRGFTLLELLVVITIIGILAGFSFGAFSAVKKLAQKTQAKNDANQIALAVSSYFNEYGRYPIAGGGGADANLLSDKAFLEILTAVDVEMNPRQISFLDPKQAKAELAGVTLQGDLVDPWGLPYKIIIDGNYDKEVENPDTVSENAPPTLRKGVIVWSEGPDKGMPSGTDPWADNVTTWK